MTEIGEMPEEWKVVTLEEAVEINGASRDPTRENPDEKILYIDIESVEGGTGIIKTAKEILGKEAPSRARRVVHQNDIIMSTVRPYLKAFALVPRDYNNQICSTGFAVLSCKNEIFPRYLLYILFSKEVIEQCNKMMMGGQYPALNQSQVAKIEIPLPPLPEQRRIAEILGTVDSAIQNVGGAIESTERLKKGLMQRLLTRGIGHERFKFSKELDSEIPEEWKVAELSEIGEVTTGKTPSTFNDTYWNGEVPFITPVDIQDSKYVYRTERYVTPAGTNQVQRILPKNAVLVVCIGSTIGKTAITHVESITNQQINSIICATEVADPNYVYYAISFKNELLKSYSGVAAVPIIKKSLFEQFKLPLPPLPEQRRIAEILSAVDRKLELERRRKEKLSRVKKGLMNELLTGRKRVKLAE